MSKGVLHGVCAFSQVARAVVSVSAGPFNDPNTWHVEESRRLDVEQDHVGCDPQKHCQ
jgi:hypothetical protein